MAIHIVRSYFSTVLFVIMIAVGILAYHFPEHPDLQTLNNPITAIVFYTVAFGILFYPWMKKKMAFPIMILSLVMAWVAVYWFYVIKGV